MDTFKRLFYFLRLIPVLPGVNWKDRRLQMDLACWQQICGIGGGRTAALAQLMGQYREFRNLFLYRNRFRRLYRLWVRLWYRPLDTLFLQAKEIGGGLFLQHAFATMVSAESIGENCWINQQVTIGYNGPGRPPIIGNNVKVTCGAKVLGSITVGDGAVIGANAVVIRDVEPGAKMGGVPAHRLRERDRNDQ